MRLSKSFAALYTIIALSTSVAWAGITSDAGSLSGQHFDYIVVGGGLAGLTVANRLSADNSTSVLVIEAGNDDRTDDRVSSLDAYGQAFGSDLDWAFQTTTQVGGKAKVVRGGRTLGGSTSINGAAWTRASSSQYDALGSLIGSGSGWNWDGLQGYMEKAEKFVPPGQAATAAGAKYTGSAHGFEGPLEITFTGDDSQQRRRRILRYEAPKNRKRMYSGPAQSAFISAIGATLGVQQVDDLCAGNGNAVAYTPNSIQSNGKRSSSASAYYTPVQDRPNLTVLTGTRAKNLIWNDSSDNSTSGVVVQQSANGDQTTINADKEVILAAGALNTPAILERSGVGSNAALKALGVAVKVNLEGVGKNLQDQTMTTIGSAADVDYSGGGPSNTIGMANINQIMANATNVRTYINDNMRSWATSVVNQGGASSKKGLLTQWRTLVSLIFDSNAPLVEFFFDTGYPANSYGIDIWPLLPFSRGSVHATAMDPFTNPTVNPNYFGVPIDLDIQVASLRSGRRILQNDNIRSLTSNGETTPGFGTIPDGPNHGSYSRWSKWIFGSSGSGDGFSAVSHQIGTTAMLPQALGGVVDGNFKVYQTRNVRVVDGSVLPIQLSAHLSSTLYGVAEKAADTILSS